MTMSSNEIQARHWRLDAAARALLDDLRDVLPLDDIEDAREDIDAGEPMIGIGSLLSYAIEHSASMPVARLSELQELHLAPFAQDPLDELRNRHRAAA